MTAQKQQRVGDSSASSSSARNIPDLFAVPELPQRALSSDIGLTVGTLTTSSTMPPLQLKKDKAGPSFNLPTSEYPNFLRAIEGSERPKPVLITELYEAFKGRCTPESGALRKGAVENKLSEIAYKEKKVWRVKQTEWVCIYA